jgi:FkbM family methyltransferase
MKLIKTKLEDLDFYYKEGDKVIGERIDLGKYEEFETILFLERLKKKMTVVDVGANIGYYTLLAAKRVARVIAIEPDGDCFEILKMNVEKNNLKNVVLIKTAAGSRKEKRGLIKDRNNMGNSHIGGENGDVVLVDSLDNILINEQQIGLLKIDVQGWEPQVILGAKKILKRDRPEMFLEYSPIDYLKNNLDEKEMMNFLRKIYKGIWEIDYWFYVYRKAGNKIRIDDKKGYADLWLKEKVEAKDFLRAYNNLQIKKAIKAIMGICRK